MSLYFRPQYARCAAPVFYRQVVPVARYVPTITHDIAPLFNLMNNFEQQLEHLQQAVNQAPRQHRQTYRKFTPKFNVKEAEQTYQLEGELPGFDAKDISIEFLDDGHTLQIKGKTVRETETGKPEAQTPAVEAAATTETAEPVKVDTDTARTETPETASIKSHQPSVEDDASEPANRSASSPAEQSISEATPAESTEAESSKAAEQQVAQKPQSAPEVKNWITERHVGEFSRTFKFTSRVNQEAVKASLKDGILAITLPFARKPESRRIEIQ